MPVTEAASTTTDSLLDLEALLLPLSTDNPVGVSLRETGLYEELDELRNKAKWKEIHDLTNEALKKRSKDLRLCVRLAEAMVWLHGLAGLRDSLMLIRGMHRDFWPGMFPLILEDNDLTARANLIERLQKTVGRAIKEVSIADGSEGEPWPYHKLETLNHLHANFNQLRKEEQDSIHRLKELWENASGATPVEFYHQKDEALSQCLDEFHLLDEIISDKYGKQAPGLGMLQETLRNIQSLVHHLISEKRPQPGPAREEATHSSTESRKTAASRHEISASTVSPIQSREEALQQLRAIAAFFRVTERHNPLPLLIELGICWAELSLDQWLKQLHTSKIDLQQLMDRLGVSRSDGQN